MFWLTMRGPNELTLITAPGRGIATLATIDDAERIARCFLATEPGRWSGYIIAKVK